ncbi:MAG: hypothetical protein KDA25_12130 [Phycisphaerales bacterium]|nr:hypothetical protein [Phycisphaerales bacterium]
MTVPQRASTAILKWMMLNADGDEIARIVDEAAEFRLSDSPGVDVEQFVARALLSWRTGQWPMLSASDLEALGYAIFGENEGLWSARLYVSVLCIDGLDRIGVPSSTAEYYCNVVAAAQYWMDPSLITCAGQFLSDMATRTDDDARYGAICSACLIGTWSHAVRARLRGKSIGFEPWDMSQIVQQAKAICEANDPRDVTVLKDWLDRHDEAPER